MHVAGLFLLVRRLIKLTTVFAHKTNLWVQTNRCTATAIRSKYTSLIWICKLCILLYIRVQLSLIMLIQCTFANSVSGNLPDSIIKSTFLQYNSLDQGVVFSIITKRFVLYVFFSFWINFSILCSGKFC